MEIRFRLIRLIYFVVKSAEFEPSNLPLRPPNIQVGLRNIESDTSTMDDLCDYFGVTTLDAPLGCFENSYAKTIKNLWLMYSTINHNSGDKSLLLECMALNHISRRAVYRIDKSITAPIFEILDELKATPEVTWNKDAYVIIEREDILEQLRLDVTVCDPNTASFKLPFLEVCPKYVLKTFCILILY